jgi:hypothetical protein
MAKHQLFAGPNSGASIGNYTLNCRYGDMPNVKKAANRRFIASIKFLRKLFDAEFLVGATRPPKKREQAPAL